MTLWKSLPLKILQEKKKMLVTSISALFQNAFYHYRNNYDFLVVFILLSANALNLYMTKI